MFSTVFYFFKYHLFLLLCIIGFVCIRSFHFSEFVNFSTDQGEFAKNALELWRNKDITLVGPTASFNYQGLYLRQSSVIFYTTLFFLLPTNFEPVQASYLFMLLSALMCIPLFYGIKKLFNEPAAVLVTSMFAFFPFFIPYTTFLWNPNYQFALVPILIFFLGLFKETRKNKWMFLSGCMAGVLFLYHYQFALIIAFGTFVILYNVWRKNTNLKSFLLWIFGLIIGYMPMIFFEIHSKFYLTKIILLLLQHPTQSSTSFAPHYILSLVFIALIVIVGMLSQKYVQVTNKKVIYSTSIVFFVLALIIYSTPPNQAFGSAYKWNYLLEQKAHHIIANEKLKNFGVVNTVYETKATVQYYLLQKNNVIGGTQNYYENEYLFLIAKKERTNFSDDPAYEVNTFVPSIEVNRWSLNSEYDVVLLQR